MTVAQQRRAALNVATAKRLNKAALKRSLRNGTMSLTAVMADPPDELAHDPLIDVIRWSRAQGKPGRPSITEIGKQALRDQVNLMTPLEDASARSRAWAAEWGNYYRRQRR